MDTKNKMLKNQIKEDIKINYGETRMPFTINYETIKTYFKNKNIVYISHIQHNNGFIMGVNGELYPDSDFYELYLIEKIDDITYIYYHYHYEHWYLNIPIPNKKEYLLNVKQYIDNVNNKLIIYDKNLDFVIKLIQENIKKY